MLIEQEEDRRANPGILFRNCTVGPFKRSLLRAAKNPQKKNLLNGVRLVEDSTPCDFELRKKALPMMKRAFEEGKKVHFT